MNPPKPPSPNRLSRRDFLRLGKIGLGAAACLTLSRYGRAAGSFSPSEALANLSRPPAFAPGQQGRVLENSLTVYDVPSSSGNKTNTYWRDSVMPLTGAAISEDTSSHNRIWYRIAEEGYAHSAAIQPVRTSLNAPVEQIPADGALAEVSVPFTDARWGPGDRHALAYRFYYETTYWVTRLVYGPNGEPWYGILDDKWEYTFYAPARHLRLLSAEELSPLSPQVPTEAKRLEVRIPEQVMIAYEWGKPVFMARVATGAKFSNGDFSTQPGRYITFHKRPSRHMATGNLAANGYDLPGVPWNSYITENGIAFHGTYWHNNFGLPRSHGCINLTPQAARWVFRWTMPIVPPEKQMAYETYGTAVDIIA